MVTPKHGAVGGFTPKLTVECAKPSPDRQFRLDLLLLGLGEESFRWLDRKLNTGGALVNRLWLGPEGLRGVLEAKIEEVGIPREKLTPRLVAEHAGFLKRRRLRRAG